MGEGRRKSKKGSKEEKRRKEREVEGRERGR